MVLDREFPPDVRVENEIEILNSLGLHVHLLAYTKKGLPERETISEGLTVHRVVIGEVVHKSSVACLKFPLYFSFWKKAVRKLIHAVKPDVLHVHDLPLARPVGACAKESSIPCILDLHENWPHMLDIAQHTNTFLGRLLSSPQQWKAYEKDMVKKADAVITVVEEMRQRVIEPGVNKSKIFVYQNVPDVKKLDQGISKVQSEGLHLYYAGGINVHRGLQIVIAALAIVKERLKGVRFSVYGSGRYLSELRDLVRQLEVGEMVQFMGWKSQHEVMQGLSSAHLAIVPHLRNVQNDHSSPNKIYQYMLSNTAVITSNCSSLQRVIQETEAGLVYEHNSPDDLAKKLIWACEHKDSLASMGEIGRAQVLSRFNTEQERRGIEDTYRLLSII